MNAKLQRVIKEFELCRPRNEKQILTQCGVGLRFVGDGSYRNVYEIMGLPVVVKIPHKVLTRQHSRDEYERWQELTTLKMRGLKKYLPKIYYFDKKSGVIIMHKYTSLPYVDPDDSAYHTEFADVHKAMRELTDMLDLACWDDHTGNFGRDEKGRVVIVDLGFFQ